MSLFLSPPHVESSSGEESPAATPESPDGALPSSESSEALARTEVDDAGHRPNEEKLLNSRFLALAGSEHNVRQKPNNMARSFVEVSVSHSFSG